MDLARKYAQTLLIIGVVLCGFGSCGAQSAWSMVDARAEQTATPEGPYGETFSLMFDLLLDSPYFRGLSIANFLLSLILLFAGVSLIIQTTGVRRRQPPPPRMSSVWWCNQATGSNALWCLADAVHQSWVMVIHRESLVSSFSRSAQVADGQAEVSASALFITTLAMVALRGLIGTAFFVWLGYRVRSLAGRILKGHGDATSA